MNRHPIITPIASWAVCLVSLAIKNILKKKNWIFVESKCIDREIREVMAQKSISYEPRILCEFEYAGAIIQCTPTVHWSSFRSEAAASKFLNSRIDSIGGCTLKVNPNNLKEANLSRGGMK